MAIEEPSICKCERREKVMVLDKKGTAWLEECSACLKLWYCDGEGKEVV